MIAYHTQAQFFVSCDQVNCLPDGVVSFRDAYRFFIIDQLAVIDKEKAGLFRYFVKQAVDGIFFLWISESCGPKHHRLPLRITGLSEAKASKSTDREGEKSESLASLYK